MKSIRTVLLLLPLLILLLLLLLTGHGGDGITVFV